jgi:hypothetical protein
MGSNPILSAKSNAARLRLFSSAYASSERGTSELQ